MAICNKCLAQPSNWAQHQRLYHTWRPHSACLHCSYQSDEFCLLLTHSLLEGHSFCKNGDEIPMAIINVCSVNDCQAQSNLNLSSNLQFQSQSLELQPDVKMEVETDITMPLQPSIDQELSLEDIKWMVPDNPGISGEESEQHNLRKYMTRRRRTSTSRTKEQQALFDNLNKEASRLKCKNCPSYIKYSSSKDVTHIYDHVRACCKIRAFGCSQCKTQRATASSVRAHIRSRCPSAQMVRLDRNSVDIATQEGMMKCFPLLQF